MWKRIHVSGTFVSHYLILAITIVISDSFLVMETLIILILFLGKAAVMHKSHIGLEEAAWR